MKGKTDKGGWGTGGEGFSVDRCALYVEPASKLLFHLFCANAH